MSLVLPGLRLTLPFFTYGVTSVAEVLAPIVKPKEEKGLRREGGCQDQIKEEGKERENKMTAAITKLPQDCSGGARGWLR